MIITLLIVSLAFLWLGYESDWMRVRLLAGVSLLPFPERWYKAFNFYKGEAAFTAEPDYSWSIEYKGYQIYRTLTKQIKYHGFYSIFLSPGIDTLCGKAWLDKHWADLKDYHPQVELYFGNGYKQTFTLRKPELMKQIIKLNTDKKYFKQLATASL